MKKMEVISGMNLHLMPCNYGWDLMEKYFGKPIKTENETRLPEANLK